VIAFTAQRDWLTEWDEREAGDTLRSGVPRHMNWLRGDARSDQPNGVEEPFDGFPTALLGGQRGSGVLGR
jgi:hypothetical protein